MMTENNLLNSVAKTILCARCSVLMDTQDEPQFIHQIKGEFYCQDCHDELEAKYLNYQEAF